MILFPAIDLKDGACVRLVKGDMDHATVYNENPGEQAQAFVEMGFSWVHVVDLDGAVAGKTENEEAVDSILWCVGDKAKVQLGGGIRNRPTIDNWLEKGVTRVILGTAAVRDPELVREAAKAYPGQIAVGIDARGGKVAIEGWTETSELAAVDLAKLFEDAGVIATACSPASTGKGRSRSRIPSRSRSSPQAASPPWPTSSGSRSPTQRSSKAPSPAARFMTGGSTQKGRLRCFSLLNSLEYPLKLKGAS